MGILMSGISPFAALCRNYRSQRGLFMGDQAEALSVSVAYISAIEIGNRPIPESYPAKVAEWLSLTSDEAAELKQAATSSAKIVKLRPTDPVRAQLAYGLSKRLNELTPDEIRRLRHIVDGEYDA
jgi:cyanate lyase